MGNAEAGDGVLHNGQSGARTADALRRRWREAPCCRGAAWMDSGRRRCCAACRRRRKHGVGSQAYSVGSRVCSVSKFGQRVMRVTLQYKTYCIIALMRVMRVTRCLTSAASGRRVVRREARQLPPDSYRRTCASQVSCPGLDPRVRGTRARVRHPAPWFRSGPRVTALGLP